MTTIKRAQDGSGEPIRNGAKTGKASMHPLDEWLRRELDSLFVAVRNDPLPPDIAELASQLERALAPPKPRKRSD